MTQAHATSVARERTLESALQRLEEDNATLSASLGKLRSAQARPQPPERSNSVNEGGKHHRGGERDADDGRQRREPEHARSLFEEEMERQSRHAQQAYTQTQTHPGAEEPSNGHRDEDQQQQQQQRTRDEQARQKHKDTRALLQQEQDRIWQDDTVDASFEAFTEPPKPLLSATATTATATSSSTPSLAESSRASSGRSALAPAQGVNADNGSIKPKPNAKESALAKPEAIPRTQSLELSQSNAGGHAPANLSVSMSSVSVPTASSSGGSVRFSSTTLSPPRTSSAPHKISPPGRARKSLAEATSMLFGDLDGLDGAESFVASTPPTARTQTSMLSTSGWLNSVYTNAGDDTVEHAPSVNQNSNGNGNGNATNGSNNHGNATSGKGSDGVAGSLLQKLMKETRETAAIAHRGGAQNRLIDIISTPSYTTFSAPSYAPMPTEKEDILKNTGQLICGCACVKTCWHGFTCCAVHAKGMCCQLPYMCVCARTHVCIRTRMHTCTAVATFVL
jgi:hypothetical protein